MPADGHGGSLTHSALLHSILCQADRHKLLTSVSLQESIDLRSDDEAAPAPAAAQATQAAPRRSTRQTAGNLLTKSRFAVSSAAPH